MTAKKDLKRRVRERQAQTGESYVSARRQVLARSVESAEAPAPSGAPDQPAAAPPFEVDEMVSLTVRAAELGFHCRVHVSGKLGRMVDHEALLRRLRDIVHATSEDPAMAKMRAVILRGERPTFPPRGPTWLQTTRQFVQRALAGIGGISEHGNMLAFTHGETIVLANIGGIRPAHRVMTDQLPRLVLSALKEDGFSMSQLFVR